MLIGVTPGRSLRWAPHWPCSTDAVLFDAGSGDYWVLSAEGRKVLEWLQAEPAIERADLLLRLVALTADGEALLAELAAAGLLMAMLDGVAVRLPSGSDADD